MHIVQLLHPASIHFPIALLLLGSAVALVHMYRLAPFDLRVTAWLLLGLGWVGAFIAVLTGLLAQSNLPPDAPYRSVLNWHIGAGVAQLVIYGFLLYRGWLYRSARRRAMRLHAGRDHADLLDDPAVRVWVTALLVIGAIAIVTSGWNGGLLVYEWGVNVH